MDPRGLPGKILSLDQAGRSLTDFRRFDESQFNLALGVRAAIFTVIPIVLALVVNVGYLLFTTLGALLLIMTEGPVSSANRRVLALACTTEAAALGVGTLIGAAPGVFAPILLGVGLFVIFLARGTPKFAALGTFTSIAFAFGVGLPGASLEAAGIRTVFLVLGGFWALLGVELHLLFLKGRKIPSALSTNPPPVAQQLSRAETLRSSLVVAVACAVGFSIGFVLGLPRDYWVVATIIFTVRPSISLTTTFTGLMAVGTVLGALIAASITYTLGQDLSLLAAILFVIGVFLFSTRGVNFGLTQLFLSSFIIILLNIAFPGEWYLAVYRVIDVGIGILMSLVLVELLERLKKTSTWL